MKKLAISLLLVYSGLANSYSGTWNDAYAPFDATKNAYKTVTLNWLITDDVIKTCSEESKKRGISNFGYNPTACAFWNGNVCTIITKKNPTMHDVGHEVRHCFQFNWH